MRIELRRIGPVLLVVVVAIGGWIALDALIVTEEERLEAFADAIAGTVEPAHVDQVIRDWTDPAREPLTVTAFGRRETYEDVDSLREDALSALRSYEGEDLTRLSQDLETAQDRAHLSLRLVSGRGLVDLEVELRKHGERWVVSELRVYR